MEVLLDIFWCCALYTLFHVIVNAGLEAHTTEKETEALRG